MVAGLRVPGGRDWQTEGLVRGRGRNGGATRLCSQELQRYVGGEQVLYKNHLEKFLFSATGGAVEGKSRHRRGWDLQQYLPPVKSLPVFFYILMCAVIFGPRQGDSCRHHVFEGSLGTAAPDVSQQLVHANTSDPLHTTQSSLLIGNVTCTNYPNCGCHYIEGSVCVFLHRITGIHDQFDQQLEDFSQFLHNTASLRARP